MWLRPPHQLSDFHFFITVPAFVRNYQQQYQLSFREVASAFLFNSCDFCLPVEPWCSAGPPLPVVCGLPAPLCRWSEDCRPTSAGGALEHCRPVCSNSLPFPNAQIAMQELCNIARSKVSVHSSFAPNQLVRDRFCKFGFPEIASLYLCTMQYTTMGFKRGGDVNYLKCLYLIRG